MSEEDLNKVLNDQKIYTKTIKMISTKKASKHGNILIFLIKVRRSYRDLSSQADPTRDD